MKNKIPPPVILLLSGIAAWFIAHSEYGYPIDIPFALIVAIVLATSGLLIAARAIRQFAKAETTVNPLQPSEASSLVDTGIFARTRNPMYLGLLLVLLGWSVWLQSAGTILVLLAFVLYLTELQIKPEEAALRKVFGQTYIDYCARVRRWI
ncbi:MAG: methyltransferase family protein [Woeseiaceae bacterium]